MPTTFTVTIGISAYNEERDLPSLLSALLGQKEFGFKLQEIIVASDGSTDNTVKRARQIKDQRISVWHDTLRLGKNARINEIFQKATSDIVVILDADIHLPSQNVISELIAPFTDKHVALVSGKIEPLMHTSFDKILAVGPALMTEAVSLLPNPNVYQCTGGIRAFKRNLYQKLRFPKITAEDVYPYLYCQKNHLGFALADQATVTYTLPTTYGAFVRQMVRYLSAPTDLGKLFGSTMVRQEFAVTGLIKIKATLKQFIKNPFYTATYLLFLLGPKVTYLFHHDVATGAWQTIR